MPHLRRQPNPHDYGDQGPNGPGSLRAQFQTPPSRHTPSNPTHQHPPSTGPQEVTPDLAPVTAHPMAQTNPFSIFRRSRSNQQPPETVEEEEELDEDYDPDEEQIEYDEGMGEDQFDPEDEIDGDEVDEVLEDQFEDGDEGMHDRGKALQYPRGSSSPKSFTPARLCPEQETNRTKPPHNRPIPIPAPTQSPRNLLPRLLDRLHLQTRLRRRRPPTLFPSAILAIRRTAATHPNPALL